MSSMYTLHMKRVIYVIYCTHVTNDCVYIFQENATTSFLRGDGTFSAVPSQHDCAIMNSALRFAAHLQHFTVSQGRGQDNAKNKLSSLQLATAKLARKHHNFQLAQRLLLKLLKTAGSSVIEKESDGKNQLLAPLLTGLTDLSSVKPSTKLDLLKIQRECAKLAHSLGYTSDAVKILCESIMQHSELGDIDWNIGNLNARSLLHLTKWLLGDRKLLTVVTKANSENSSLVSKLSSLCDLEVAYLGHGHSTLMKSPEEEPASPRGSDRAGAKGVASGVSDPEYLCGQLLHLSTMQAPDLGKAWFNLAGWCYRWGRKTVEQARYDLVVFGDYCGLTNP